MTDIITPAQGDLASNAEMHQVEAQAERELGDLFRSDANASPAQASPAPEPAPPVQETPTQAAPQADQTPQEPPKEGEPKVSPPPQVTPEEESVKRFESMYGGDKVAAAKAALETNTRAAQMATKLRELGIDPKTMQPLAQPPVQKVEQTPPAPEADARTVQAETNRILDSDPVFSGYVQEFLSNKSSIEGLQTERAAIADAVAQAKLALKIPQVTADPLEKDRYEIALERGEAKLLQLDLRKSLLEGKQERLNALADQRTAAARSAVENALRSHYAQQEEEAAQAALVQEYRAEFQVSFPNAIEKAIKDFSIPEGETADFKADVKARALAAVALDEPIEDVYGFVASQAKVLMDRYDRYHRGKSAEYARAVQNRTAIATSSAPSATPAPPVAAPTTNDNPQSLYAYEQELAKEAALVARQMGLFT